MRLMVVLILVFRIQIFAALGDDGLRDVTFPEQSTSINM
jgi:hypothetical protein